MKVITVAFAGDLAGDRFAGTGTCLLFRSSVKLGDIALLCVEQELIERK